MCNVQGFQLYVVGRIGKTSASILSSKSISPISCFCKITDSDLPVYLPGCSCSLCGSLCHIVTIIVIVCKHIYLPTSCELRKGGQAFYLHAFQSFTWSMEAVHCSFLAVFFHRHVLLENCQSPVQASVFRLLSSLSLLYSPLRNFWKLDWGGFCGKGFATRLVLPREN